MIADKSLPVPTPLPSPVTSRAPETAAHSVELDRVSKVFGRKAALQETTPTFLPQRIYVLLGDNGAGKSTMMRIIAGLSQPTSGRVLLHNIAAEHLGYMAHASLLYEELSAMENLLYFDGLYETRKDTRARCADALTSVGLDAENPQPVRDYSQGMRQRLSLARAVVHGPRLLLLDEPFSNVDVASVPHMTRKLAELRNGGCTVILITHQMNLVKDLGDDFITLRAGQVVANRRRGQLRPTEIS